jgi:Protein of unknown function (DUF4232)
MRFSMFGLAVVAAVALSACGGGSSGATTGARSAAATVSQSTAAGSTTAASSTAASTTAGSTTAGSSTTTTVASSASGSGGAGVGGSGTECTAAGLTVSFLGGQGATGHGELGFALRNTGPACTTGGYPGIQFLDRAGGALATTPTHTTDDFFGHLPLRVLALAPGQSVSFRLGVSHGAGATSAGCTTAYGLQVIAPNDTATMRVQIPAGASECGAATVSPVQPGDSAYQ